MKTTHASRITFPFIIYGDQGEAIHAIIDHAGRGEKKHGQSPLKTTAHTRSSHCKTIISLINKTKRMELGCDRNVHDKTRFMRTESRRTRLSRDQKYARFHSFLRCRFAIPRSRRGALSLPLCIDFRRLNGGKKVSVVLASRRREYIRNWLSKSRG